MGLSCRRTPSLLTTLLFSVVVVGWNGMTIMLDVATERDPAGEFMVSLPSFRPRLQEFHGESSEKSHNDSFVNNVFVYANQTYHYRYSSKLLSKRFPPVRDGKKSLASVIFGVCANAAKPIRRQAIRKSWGRDVPVYYLVAGSWNGIAEEFLQQGDLLWVDIPEDYRNALTPKTLAFLHFGSRVGMTKLSADYLFKTDDDVYINATEMSRELIVNDLPDYYGLLRNETGPIRNMSTEGIMSKWYISVDEYPEDIFPPYAHGTGYAISKKFAHCASRAMALMLPMPWEDVATGILAKACHVSLTPSDEEWSHFVPFDKPQSEWTEFPYHRFKDGNVLVKILHKVKPWFFQPLSQQASLVEAREYGGKKIKEFRLRRQNMTRMVPPARNPLDEGNETISAVVA